MSRDVRDLHALIQKLEMQGCWGLAQSLRKILLTMVVK